MKCTVTPLFGGDVGDGFGEVPEVAVKILSVVLALAIGVILRFSQDDGSVLARAFAVTVGIFDTNLNDVRIVGRYISFGDGEAALAGFHLDAVIGNAETDGEAKSLSQPIGGSAWIGVNEHGYHGARRHRSIASHFETLSPVAGVRRDRTRPASIAKAVTLAQPSTSFASYSDCGGELHEDDSEPRFDECNGKSQSLEKEN